MEQQMERVQVSTQYKDPFTASLLIGVGLVTAGALLWRESSGLPDSIDLGRSWPVFIIVLAFAQMVATVKERRQQGFGLLLAGDWLLANTMTNWNYVQFTVPLLLAGLGLMTIVRGMRDDSGQSDKDQRATQ
jgi:hypothetical protein